MRKTATLFEPAALIGDLCIQALAPLAQLFLFKLMALADTAGGFVRLGDRRLTVDGMADALGVGRDDAADYVAAIVEMGWLERDADGGYFIPSMRQRAEMRAKRQRAGKRGGDATTAGRTDVSAFCSSKTADRAQTRASRQIPDKRTPFYKNNNNKIIIFGRQVDAFDRGEQSNPLWIDGKVMKIYRKDYDVLRDLTGYSDAYLDQILDRQDEWLARQDATAQAGWWPLTMSIMKRHIGASATVQ